MARLPLRTKGHGSLVRSVNSNALAGLSDKT
jgi:hypothetical protein